MFSVALALRLDVPVGLAYIDYVRRSIGVRQFVRMSGEIERNLALLRAFYADKARLHPHNASAIAFRDQPENDRMP